MHPAFAKKSAGVLVPVFSLRSDRDLGVGEFLDVIAFLDWMRSVGFSVFNTIPLNESILDSGCPYTALSAFALDPVFLTLEALEDVQAAPKAAALLRSKATAKSVAAWRGAPDVQFLPIRKLKFKVLERAFERFVAEEWNQDSDRARALRGFIERHADWIEDYAAFRVLKEKYDWESWLLWPEKYRRREAKALAKLRQDNGERLLFFKYLQWLCYEQWGAVQKHAAKNGMVILGDVAFLVEKESADVWARPQEFSMENTVGAPPDMFNPEGQKWGVPAYQWDKLTESDFAWWRARLRQAVELFDVFRIDHVVGFFRMYVFPKVGKPGFVPADEPSQERRGADFLKLVLEEVGAGKKKAWMIAEDLGVIPDYVRTTMARLEIPGYKVLRWERQGDAFIEPVRYPYLSVAVPGTHDTSPLATWWHEIKDGERWHLAAMAYRKHWDGPLPAFDADLLTHIQERLLEAGSAMVILPLQDVFGWTGQINFPGTVGPHNWTWRMPQTIGSLSIQDPFKKRAAILKGLLERFGRN